MTLSILYPSARSAGVLDILTLLLPPEMWYDWSHKDDRAGGSQV